MNPSRPLQLHPCAAAAEGEHADQRQAKGWHEPQPTGKTQRPGGESQPDARQRQSASAPPRFLSRQRRAHHVEERIGIRRRGRHTNILPASKPEDERREKHQQARNPEGDARAVAAQENGHQERGEKRSEIDAPVERVEHDLRALLVRLIELIADERCNQRLDAAGSDCDEEESGVEPRAIVVERREQCVPGAIDQRQPQDRRILAKEPIRDPAADQRKEINADHEGMKDILGNSRALRFGRVQQQRTDEKRRQDVAHSVEAETFARFVRDDVRNLPRHAVRRGGRRRERCCGGGRTHDRLSARASASAITPAPCGSGSRRTGFCAR